MKRRAGVKWGVGFRGAAILGRRSFLALRWGGGQEWPPYGRASLSNSSKVKRTLIT